MTVMVSGKISQIREINTDEWVESEICRSDSGVIVGGCVRRLQKLLKSAFLFFFSFLYVCVPFHWIPLGKWWQKFITELDCIKTRNFIMSDVYVWWYFVSWQFFPYVQFLITDSMQKILINFANYQTLTQIYAL